MCCSLSHVGPTSPHVVSSCEHHHTLAYSIVADRSEDDDSRPLEGWEHPPTADRPDYRKGRWRPAIHRGTDKQYVECAVTNSRLFQTHSTSSIAQGSGDAERHIYGANHRVAPSCRVAQIAAVIGREFSHDLLSAASQIDEDDSSRPSRYSNRPTLSIELAFRLSSVSPSNMCCCVMQSTPPYLGVRGSRSMRTSRRSYSAIFRSWSKINPSSRLTLSGSRQPPIGYSSLVRGWTTRYRAFRQRRSDC